MLPDKQSFRLSRRSSIAIVAFWVVFTLAAVPVTGIGQWVKTGRLDLVNQIIWESSWLGWAPLSLLVVVLCRRFPLDRQRQFTSALRLGSVGIGIVGLQLLIECVVNTALGVWLRDYGFDWKRYLLIVTYKSHAYYLVFWMIAGAAHALEFHRRFRETELISSQLESKLANAELSRLKAQLQPHFLFNAHHAIVALMLKRDNEGAIRMLTRLSDLLRISLSRSGQQVVTLREEIETLRLYLEIQSERFRDRLTISVDVPPALNDAEFPHLLLQPLVENALRHGLENVTANGRLVVEVKRDADTLVCSVCDNGAGFHSDGDNAGPAVDGRSGVGLANTRERLQQLYGKGQSLAVDSRPAEGCSVVVRIPCRISRGSRPIPEVVPS